MGQSTDEKGLVGYALQANTRPAQEAWNAAIAPLSPASRKNYEAAANWVSDVNLRCSNPYIGKNLQAFGCGQCLPCRINKRREWTHRILLESLMSGDNAFVTLTYESDLVRSLEPEHARNFLKRIRKAVAPRKLRFYLVGEYGDKSERPHYHLALFNHPTCGRLFTSYNRNGINCCRTCQTFQSYWPFGNIYLGTLEPHSAAYIAGYVTKKMTRTDDVRLGNRHPEFARMSLKPGIGYHALHEIASVLIQYQEQEPDVPTALRHGSRKILPLGRYLTRSLRELTGREKAAPLETLQIQQEKLQVLRDATWDLSSHSFQTNIRKEAFKNLIIKTHQGQRDQIIHRNQLYGKKHEKV